MALHLLYSEAYALNETIDTSVFSTKASGSKIDSTYYIWFGAIVVFFIIIGVIYSKIKNKRIKRVDQRYLQKKEEARKQLIDFSDDTSDRVEILAEATGADPDKILISNKAFELAVERLRKKSPNDPLLKKIPILREDLGYTFFNRKAVFMCTQMLQSGQKLRVSVKYQNKSHSYVSAIIESNENDFWVKPPNAKGKAVDLSKFKQLGFSVFRKNDGEYRFTCRLKSQISTPVNALVVEHTKKIKKLHVREHDRYKLQFKRKIFFSDINANKSLNGIVLDISIGGLKMLVKEIPPEATEGVNVFFKLEEADIKQDIKAEIVRITKQKDRNFIHLRFQDMSELNRLYLQKFVASKNPVKLKPQ